MKRKFDGMIDSISYLCECVWNVKKQVLLILWHTVCKVPKSYNINDRSHKTEPKYRLSEV